MAQRRQPNVLLVTIDTLRTDRVGPGGALRAETPTLDRLAAQGAYGAAHVQLPQTLPNHASMLTGTYVQTHGLRTTLWNQARDSVPTLDQRFRAAGYCTAGIVSWFSFDNRFTNLVRAYDHWEQVVTRYGTKERVDPAETREAALSGAEMSKGYDGDAQLTTDATLAWLNAHGTHAGTPWFLWLHYRDPHYPFTPPPTVGALPPLADEFDGGPVSIGRVTSGYAPTPGEMARLLAAYDGEITYTDAQLGRVIRRLDELGLSRDTIVVVTADHGESFLEHGPWDWLHGHSVYEPAVRVPLVVRYPASPQVVPGTRLTEVVQSADVAPTVLALCGLPGGEEMEGRSITPLLDGSPELGTPRAAWGTIFDDSQSFLVQGDWKLVRWNDPTKRVGHELFHLKSDPGETYDYSAEAPGVADALRASMDLWLDAKNAGRPWRPWQAA